MHVTGTYLASSATPLNLVVDANRLNLKLIEPFSVGQVRNATGYASGRLTVTGAPSAPVVRGTINTSADAGFHRAAAGLAVPPAQPGAHV